MLVRFASLLLLASLCCAQAVPKQAPKRSAAFTPEQRTAKYFDSIKHDPVKLRAFLHAMPKGGDLHNHLSGAVYAESYIQWAGEMGLCATKDYTLVAAKQKDICDDLQEQRPVSDYAKDAKFYNGLIDALSMRNWNIAREPGEYHFFSTFSKFGAVSRVKKGDMLAEVMHRAAAENTLYLELILTIDSAPWLNAGKANPWPADGSADLAEMHKKMLASGLAEATNKRSAVLDQMEARAREVLRCDQKESAGLAPDAGCGVTVRYISEVYRLGAREHVFAQLIWGFELAKHDPRVVAVNLVQPEDGLVAMRDYDLHMRMLDHLHKQYPEVHIALHAGELGFTQVLPTELGAHIPKAIDMGHAERIGHGTDVFYYEKPEDLMKEMAAKHIAVEISPSSSEMILGIKGAAHPLRAYLDAGVPVVISTDDAGVARSDLTNEYLRAVMESGLSYAELKRISRQTAALSFAGRSSIWSDQDFSLLPECRRDEVGWKENSRLSSSGWAHMLGINNNESIRRWNKSSKCIEASHVVDDMRAKIEWDLEEKLDEFERSH